MTRIIPPNNNFMNVYLKKKLNPKSIWDPKCIDFLFIEVPIVVLYD